mmetsp:Transcript_49384/g.96565  ORF Transcript_49384/g.96565 Transcript_49384/m.96565 type:complete len:214 (+) Transcript_49384:709-1350(+)
MERHHLKRVVLYEPAIMCGALTTVEFVIFIVDVNLIHLVCQQDKAVFCAEFYHILHGSLGQDLSRGVPRIDEHEAVNLDSLLFSISERTFKLLHGCLPARFFIKVVTDQVTPEQLYRGTINGVLGNRGHDTALLVRNEGSENVPDGGGRTVGQKNGLWIGRNTAVAGRNKSCNLLTEGCYPFGMAVGTCTVSAKGLLNFPCAPYGICRKKFFG